MSVRSPESRRISSLLVERGFSVSATMAVLSVSLLFGVVGFALHTFWNVAIVVLALGIGSVVANAYLDRTEVIQRRAERPAGQVIPDGNLAPPGPIYQNFECVAPHDPASPGTECENISNQHQ
jgi:hypothetical protein